MNTKDQPVDELFEPFLTDYPQFNSEMAQIKEGVHALLQAECNRARKAELKHLDRHATWYPDGSEPIEVQRRISQLQQLLKEGE